METGRERRGGIHPPAAAVARLGSDGDSSALGDPRWHQDVEAVRRGVDHPRRTVGNEDGGQGGTIRRETAPERDAAIFDGRGRPGGSGIWNRGQTRKPYV